VWLFSRCEGVNESERGGEGLIETYMTVAIMDFGLSRGKDQFEFFRDVYYNRSKRQ